MSVTLTMVAVLTTVPTPRALSRAAAEVGTHWQGMEEAVMVRPTQLTVVNISTKHTVAREVYVATPNSLSYR